jgi:hypothetical protein
MVVVLPWKTLAGVLCRAFFPLVSSLATYPVPAYGGSAHAATPVRDALFGGAAQCARGDAPDILLDSVPYAARGAFSVNLWFQARGARLLHPAVLPGVVTDAAYGTVRGHGIVCSCVMTATRALPEHAGLLIA